MDNPILASPSLTWLDSHCSGLDRLRRRNNLFGILVLGIWVLFVIWCL
jgi:hypothetical protein